MNHKEGLKNLLLDYIKSYKLHNIELDKDQQCEILELAHSVFKEGSEELDRRRRENFMENFGHE